MTHTAPPDAAKKTVSGEDLLKEMFLRSPVPTILVDTNTRRIATTNRAFTELTGFLPTQMRGLPLADIDEAVPAEVDQFVLRASQHLEDRPGLRTFRCLDGTSIEVEVESRALGGNPAALVAMFAQDMRPIRETQQERARLQSQLWMAQKHEAVGRLATGLAHDFNNLLSTIMLTADSMLAQVSDDERGAEVRADIDAIQNAGLQGRGLTRELLAFTGKQVLSPRSLSLNDVVTGMEPLVRRTIPEDIDLVVRRCDGPAGVKADLTQMQQVVLNLVVNARDAMPDGGYLVIQVTEVELDEAFARSYATVQPGPHVMLSVTDTGVGMDDETRARIFEPFFTTHRRGKGTGLGLATVYGIVKQSGGSIWVTSEPGVGTTFRIYLPRISGGWLGEELSVPGGAQGSGEHVLLVEDDEMVLASASKILRDLGYNVTEAISPEEALRLHDELWPHTGPHPIDLVITDVVMPGMSGVELARRLHEKREDLPVLYISGYLEPMHDETTRAEPIEPRLQKPFTRDELARELRELLDR